MQFHEIIKMKTLLFILTTVFLCHAQENKCPKIDVSACSCKTYLDGTCILTCSLATQADIDRIADMPDLCNGNVHFVLVNSNISGIPAKLWKTLLSSQSVDISIKYSEIEGLIAAGGNDIPEVYTSGSAVIKIDHSKVGRWDWTLLGKFYSEEELTLVIDDTPLPEIGLDFSSIAEGQVHKVAIDSTGLTKIPDKLFAGFKDLNSLSLQNNQLTSVSRSMIPEPANKLTFLHLNGNLLTTLPGDLFKDMPVLSVVYLRDNQLTSLPQELFLSISKRLRNIDLLHNPWECNCSLMGILDGTKNVPKLGVCATPVSLAGKKVADLPKLLSC